MQEHTRKKIMLVDDNKTNLAMGKSILSHEYDVYPLPSANKLFEFIEHVTPDLILLDIQMPEIDGYEAIKHLKADERYKNIPIIFVTANSSESAEYEGLDLGAVDYIIKPFSPSLLTKRIENHLTLQSQKAQLSNYADNLLEMVKEKTDQVHQLHNAVITIMANLVEFRDNFTGRHICRTQKYLEILVEQLNKDSIYTEQLNKWDMDVITRSSQLHDLGKIAVSDTILNKPGRLTEEEFEIMKSHAIKGVEAIEKMEKDAYFADFLEHAKLFAGTHHEKWDGSGYPYGFSGEKIPLEGRIMAIADVYDALISVRPYKKAFSAEEAARIIIEGAGVHFDPTLVKAFKKVQDSFAAVAKEYAEDC